MLSLRYITKPATAAALLLAASCAKPTTMQPRYSDTEFQAEQQTQAAAVQAANAGKFNDQKDYSPEQLSALKARLDPIASRIAAASGGMCADLGKRQCQFQVVLDPKEKGLNAHADGQRVVIYPAMIEFATDDNQLAFVIAHEFAHSIMAHVASQQKNVAIGGILGTLGDIAAQSRGYETGGALGKLGAQQALLRYSPSFENEADYVGLYILARAGYKIEDAPLFWRSMSLNAPQAVYASTTHPNNPSRTVAMQKTVAEINAKKQAGQPLMPNTAPKS